MTLDGTRVAILIAPRGTEEPEFTDPKSAIEEAGGTVTVISTQTGEAEAVTGDLDPAGRYRIDTTAGEVSADDFDALVIPGGCVGADTLRADADVVSLVRSFFDQNKTVAAICHAPWIVIEAGAAKGRRITAYPTLETDLRNAGAEWTDEECVEDKGLITSRTPDDLSAFCDRIVSALSKRAA